jgi:hypothetical protein
MFTLNLLFACMQFSGQEFAPISSLDDIDFTDFDHPHGNDITLNQFNAQPSELTYLDIEEVFNGYDVPCMPDAEGAVETGNPQFPYVLHVPGLNQLQLHFLTPRGRKINAVNSDGICCWVNEFDDEVRPLLVSDFFNATISATHAGFTVYGGNKEASIALQPNSKVHGGTSMLQQALPVIVAHLARCFHLFPRQIAVRTAGGSGRQNSRPTPLANIYINGPCATLASEMGQLKSDNNAPPKTANRTGWPRSGVVNIGEETIERVTKSDTEQLGQGVAGFGAPQMPGFGTKPGFGAPQMGLANSGFAAPSFPGMASQTVAFPGLPGAKKTEDIKAPAKYWSRWQGVEAKMRLLPELTAAWAAGAEVQINFGGKYASASEHPDIGDKFPPHEMAFTVDDSQPDEAAS